MLSPNVTSQNPLKIANMLFQFQNELYHRLLIKLDHSLGDPNEWVNLFRGLETGLDSFA
jgi:hypothetical protein